MKDVSIHSVNWNVMNRSSPLYANYLLEVLAQNDVTVAHERVGAGKQAKHCRFAPSIRRSARMPEATPVVGFDGAAHQHQRGLAGDLSRDIGSQGSETITLNQNSIDASQAKEFAEGEPCEGRASRWSDTNFELSGGWLADFDTAFDSPCEDVQIEVLGETFHQTNVRAALDHKQEPPLQPAHLSKIGSN